MSKIDAAQLWSLNYRLLLSVIRSVEPEIAKLGLDAKSLSLLAAVDEHPHPAELAVELVMPKPTVTVIVKRLEAAGFLKREIDPADLRKHRLTLTTSARKAVTRGMGLLSKAFGERLARLDARDHATLYALLDKMI